MITDSTQRFSSRVENYRRYRPGYPAELLQVLRANAALTDAAAVADIGSGTGILTEMLLQNGNRVFAVEPNDAMRAAAEDNLLVFPGFTSVSGTAEATTLAPQSIDLITAAQAFHWFERTRTKAEFTRILQPGGWIALIWNERELDSTAFLRGYESLLREFGHGYLEVRRQDLDIAQVREFFGESAVQQTTLKHGQVFDYAGIAGRLLSSSYAPESGDSKHAPMLQRLRELFDAFSNDGTVELRYDTQVYCAQL